VNAIASRKKRKGTIKRPAQVKRMLVAVDFSPGAAAALQYATALARCFGSSVTVLNVAEVNDGWLHLAAKQFPLLDRQLAENHRRSLVELARESGVAPQDCVVRVGRPVEQIVKAVRELKADLIVIGTRGLTGLKHAIIGSTAEGVVRHAHCPVWIVPN
jgi:nucleotide-binding universal stress UspA family protein